ncbi:NifB/NifX family molybdenum-iron cluster-binding protein [Azospirillum doebereinerae]|uniref:Nitrogenase accessory factor n=1 Tax=Azospirillum doebereinerae TaxID=92933 RepID=A0A433J9M5_9PROT|nr:nitrogenase accessory factor [Azospirillum doebereinerae]MCG5243895.1 nitrogenase accessory factor [Azospirillum doebereinerae]RUQ71511.1 nitrogenase accessory factor [Azospirillum doebereinerae]
MKIAVGTQDFHTIATHGGRTRRFLVFEAEPGRPPSEVARIELAEDEVLHLCGDGRPHPIDAVGLVIAGASGAGFVAHMKRRGIVPVTTTETDPIRAIRAWFAGTIETAAEPAHPHEHHDGAHHHEHEPG